MPVTSGGGIACLPWHRNSTNKMPVGKSLHPAVQTLAEWLPRVMHKLVKPRDGGDGELRTIRDFLRWAVSRFRESGIAFGQGTTNALDEAAFLILETLHLPPDDINPWLDARVTVAER